MFVCEVFGRCLLGGRSMVGHAALDRVIGVRIPASQPLLAAPRLWTRGRTRLPLLGLAITHTVGGKEYVVASTSDESNLPVFAFSA